jgi:hypothetical protein
VGREVNANDFAFERVGADGRTAILYEAGTKEVHILQARETATQVRETATQVERDNARFVFQGLSNEYCSLQMELAIGQVDNAILSAQLCKPRSFQLWVWVST